MDSDQLTDAFFIPKPTCDCSLPLVWFQYTEGTALGWCGSQACHARGGLDVTIHLPPAVQAAAV